MKLMQYAAIAALLLVTGCAESPQDNTENLGTTEISEYQRPLGSYGRRDCMFRVHTAKATLTFTGSVTTPVQTNKCKALHDGDTITVIKKSKKWTNGRETEIRYTGHINEIVFPLN